MKTLSPRLRFLLDAAQFQSVVTRKFDAALGGLSLSEFMILLALRHAQDERLRRIDLADAVGLTASGVTRLLAPMEKIGLVKRQTNAHDARVSLVSLAAGGKRKLEEALDGAEQLAATVLTAGSAKHVEAASVLMSALLRK